MARVLIKRVERYTEVSIDDIEIKLMRPTSPLPSCAPRQNGLASTSALLPTKLNS